MESIRIILCPEDTLIDNEHTLTQQTWFLMSTDCSVIGPHLHHVADTAIHKTASTADNHLDTNVHAISSGTYVTDSHKYHENPQLGWSQCLCNITLASPHCSFHNCNYCFTGTCIGRCTTLTQHVFPPISTSHHITHTEG